MSSHSVPNLRPLAPGIILALLSIAFGFLLGGAFGAAEDSIKGHLRSSADPVFETVYQSDASKRDAVLSKSWEYMKRAHLHGGAIGAAALASIVLLGLSGSTGLLERTSAAAFGAGSLLYSGFWLVAGLAAPSVGSTGAAKEALSFLAIPGAGLCLLGIGGTLLSVLRQLIARPITSG
ncbi:hypothetical protein [Adhaeretor mobilis]|uniref:Uncharacterized protein n=1 Tax=Adhaeretor mobilis TaxID=1930276 RepID=A0A517MZZ4_9BACT|nr:hypothetical protein [Adhaeretor mobilis]QDT00457.1 hypothetical protein HG15A2_37950 [Adhaeretor mobilis]